MGPVALWVGQDALEQLEKLRDVRPQKPGNVEDRRYVESRSLQPLDKGWV